MRPDTSRGNQGVWNSWNLRLSEWTKLPFVSKGVSGLFSGYALLAVAWNLRSVLSTETGRPLESCELGHL